MPIPNSQKAREMRENELLAALPADAFERLFPWFESVALPQAQILYGFDETVTHLYFPHRNTMVSILCRADEDINVEVAICGNEGAVGLSGILGFASSPLQILVQVPGTGTRLALDEARNEFSRCGAFHDLLMKYTHALLLQVSQTALCNRIHSDEERLARWLLFSHDRVQSRQLPLPREVLGKMLGRNLAGVSVAASALQRAGIITYNGAELVIVDREKLEAVSCSCYWHLKRQTASLQTSQRVL